MQVVGKSYLALRKNKRKRPFMNYLYITHLFFFVHCDTTLRFQLTQTILNAEIVGSLAK